MIKYRRLVTAAVVAPLLTLVVPAPAAFANECGGKATQAEFEDIRDDWTLERVRDKFDSQGTITGEIIDHGEVVRRDYSWDWCGDNGYYARITFRNGSTAWRVVNKAKVCGRIGGCS